MISHKKNMILQLVCSGLRLPTILCLGCGSLSVLFVCLYFIVEFFKASTVDGLDIILYFFMTIASVVAFVPCVILTSASIMWLIVNIKLFIKAIKILRNNNEDMLLCAEYVRKRKMWLWIDITLCGLGALIGIKLDIVILPFVIFYSAITGLSWVLVCKMEESLIKENNTKGE